MSLLPRSSTDRSLHLATGAVKHPGMVVCESAVIIGYRLPGALRPSPAAPTIGA
jgi:hypothetical protein